MNDERKTKKELIAELEEMRGENAELRQNAGGGDSVVERQLAVERICVEAMVMRSSDDLKRVVAVLHREMEGLGIESPYCGINFVDEKRGGRTMIHSFTLAYSKMG